MIYGETAVVKTEALIVDVIGNDHLKYMAAMWPQGPNAKSETQGLLYFGNERDGLAKPGYVATINRNMWRCGGPRAYS